MRLAGRLLASAILLAIGAASVTHAFGGQTYFGVDIPALYVDQASHLRRTFGATVEQNAPVSQAAARSLALDILRRAPMDFSALVYYGYFAGKNGDLQSADRAVALGVKRNPRNLFGHMWAAEKAAQRRDFDRAVDEIVILITIDPGSAERYIDFLVALAVDPASHDALARIVETRPSWGQSFLGRLGRAGTSEKLVARLAGIQGVEVKGLLDGLLAQGRIDEAFVIWMDSLHANAVAFEWPYDGDFRGAPGGAPFNWSLRTDGAELQRGGGLFVSYQGRGQEEVIDQTTLLGPGLYGISVRANGQSNPRGGRLRWIVSCLPSGPEVAQLDMRPTDSVSVFALAFAIPKAGCSAQSVSLRGAPGEIPTGLTANISSVKIETLAE